jgi:hypothetical protein
MIDPATEWFEIQQYDDKQSITVANIIEQEWFSRYPWPTQVTLDRGSEFIIGVAQSRRTLERWSLGMSV